MDTPSCKFGLSLLILALAAVSGCSKSDTADGTDTNISKKLLVRVSGLSGSGLTLAGADGIEIQIPNDGEYEIVTPRPKDVWVSREPTDPVQTCPLQIDASANVGSKKLDANVRCATVSPRFAYSLNFGHGSVSHYQLNPLSGELKHIQTLMTGKNPVLADTDSRNRYLFVVNRGSASLSAFGIDSTTGALSELIGSPFTTDANAAGSAMPTSVAVHPSGQFVYVSNAGASNNVSAFRVDEDAGTLRPLPGSPFSAGKGPSRLIFNSAGNFAYLVNHDSNDIFTFEIDSKTGALRELREFRVQTGAKPGLGSLHRNGRFLFVPNVESEDLSAFAIDANTGKPTPIEGSPYKIGPGTSDSVFIHPGGHYLFTRTGRPNSEGAIRAYRIDARSGSLKPVADEVKIPEGATRMSIDPTGRYLYVLFGWRPPAPGQTPIRRGSMSVGTIDGVSGRLSFNGNLMSLSYIPFSMSLDPSGRFLYVAAVAPSLIFSYRIENPSGEIRSLINQPITQSQEQPIFIAILHSNAPAP